MGEPRLHVLTGATSGIGREIARRLTERGDKLVLPVRSEDRIEALATEFPDHYEIPVVDLEDPDAVVAWAKELGRGRPPIERVHSLVHSAGVVDVTSVEDQDPASWQRTLAVNLTAPALLTRGLLPQLRAAQGTVVFLNSGSGLRSNPHWASYNAAKFGLRGFADALRQEEQEYGVRVTSIYPGRTATPMQERVHAQEGREYDETRWIRPETVAEAIVSVLDLGPDATVTDLTVRPR